MATILSVSKEITDLVSGFQILKSRRKEIESNIIDYLHWLELLGMNAVEISKVTKALKIAYRERRKIKEEIHMTELFIERYLNLKTVTAGIDLEEIVTRSSDRLER